MIKPFVSKTLVKLIDKAIFPAILIVAAKVTAVLFLSLIYSDKITIQTGGFLKIFPAITHSSYQGYYFVNSWSNMVMFSLTVVGTSIILIKAHFFHQSHIKPSFHAKLARLKLSGLVVSTFTLYHQAAIWLAYLWIIISFLVIEAYFRSSSMMLAVVALLAGINATWFLISDVEHELEIWREHHPNF